MNITINYLSIPIKINIFKIIFCVMFFLRYLETSIEYYSELNNIKYALRLAGWVKQHNPTCMY